MLKADLASQLGVNHAIGQVSVSFILSEAKNLA